MKCFMVKRRSIICVFVFLLCLIACKSNKSERVLLDAVPLEASMILEIGNLDDFVQMAKSKSYVNDMSHIVNLGEFGCMVSAIDTLSGNDKGLLSSSALMVLLNDDGCQGTFLLLKPENSLKNSGIVKLLETRNIAYNKFDGDEESCYGFCVSGQDSLYISSNGDFVSVSTDPLTCLKPFAQLDNQEKITMTTGFGSISSTLGTSVGTHVFVMSDLLLKANGGRFADKAKNTTLPILNDDVFAAACDFLLKDEGLIISGYAVATDSSDVFKLKYQQPVRNSIINVLPYDVRMMLHYGMSDMASWLDDKTDKNQIATINKKCGVDAGGQFAANVSEIALAMLSTNNSPIAVARLNDPAAVIKFMGRIDASYGVTNEHTTQGCTVKTLNADGLGKSLLGDEFAKVNHFCYTILDQYLVIANRTSDVDEVIAMYRSGRTLDLNENFRAFQDNMLEEANISFYLPFHKNIDFVKSYLSKDMCQFVDQNKNAFESFQAFSLQMSSARSLIYTNVFLRQFQSSNQENRVIWKTTLDAPLSSKPFILPDLAGGERVVFAFDNLNNAYLIDAKGNVKWKKSMSEPLMGDVKTVDCYNDGKTQYLFNTANYIHLIDRNGEYIEGYPLRLPVEASNGLAVFDYQNTKDYRILLCGTDKLVYNFTIKGNETEGWNRHRTDNLVTKPVEHLVADDKDYIILTDVKGTVRILDRQGRVRVPLAGDLQKSPTSDIYCNRTNRKGIMMTSSKDGKLLYITSDGQTAQTDFGDFGENHFFLYEDFNQDSDPDFIYLDGNELRIFDKFKKDLFAYTFMNEIKQKPMFFNITRNRRLLGIVSETSRKIYLIDKNGTMVSSSGIIGETPFDVGSLLNNNEINLVTGVGNTLFNYSLK